MPSWFRRCLAQGICASYRSARVENDGAEFDAEASAEAFHAEWPTIRSRPFRKTLRRDASSRTHTPISALSAASAVSGPWNVPVGQASVIFAEAPGGSLAFSGQHVANGGGFFLGTDQVSPALSARD